MNWLCVPAASTFSHAPMNSAPASTSSAGVFPPGRSLRMLSMPSCTRCNHRFLSIAYAECRRECIIPCLEGPGITTSECPICKQPGWKNDLRPNHQMQNIANIVQDYRTSRLPGTQPSSEMAPHTNHLVHVVGCSHAAAHSFLLHLRKKGKHTVSCCSFQPFNPPSDVTCSVQA